MSETWRADSGRTLQLSSGITPQQNGLTYSKGYDYGSRDQLDRFFLPLLPLLNTILLHYNKLVSFERGPLYIDPFDNGAIQQEKIHV